MASENHWPTGDVDAAPTEDLTREQPTAVIDTIRSGTGYAQPVEYAPAPRLPDPEENDEELVEELLDQEPLPELPPTPATRLRRGVGLVLMTMGGLIALLVLAYAADLMLSAGDVPRGVRVEGIEVGGLARADAEARLRRELEPRLTQPVPIHAGDVHTVLVPERAGLGLDWPATLDHAGHQPLNPITRVLSFFTSRDVGVATGTEPKTLERAVTGLAQTQLDHAATEGTIQFVSIPDSDGGVTASAVEPRQGQVLSDLAAAAKAISDGWLDRAGVSLPMTITPVSATSEGVHRALDDIVVPAVAKPVVLHGDGRDAALKPAVIAGSFQFVPQPDGSLQVNVDRQKLRETVEPELASTEKPGKDAQIVFAGGAAPTVQPSENARTINWDDTLKPFAEVLRKPGDRELPVLYRDSKPAMTTEAANALGIREVIGEFTTSDLTADAVPNAEAMAGAVSGAIVKPGETFSLDARTGPRTVAQGYVSAPLNEDGTGPKVIGGGVSQLTSTLYNAVYLAGLKDSGHTEHGYFLDRYPPAREARSMRENGAGFDLRFTNDGPTGVAIQAEASAGSVTVRIWGTKRYRVESLNGGRSDVVRPPVRMPAPGEDCRPSAGVPGFHTSDTRVLYDLTSGGEVRRETRNVTYQPRPFVMC